MARRPRRSEVQPLGRFFLVPLEATGLGFNNLLVMLIYFGFQ